MANVQTLADLARHIVWFIHTSVPTSRSNGSGHVYPKFRLLLPRAEPQPMPVPRTKITLSSNSRGCNLTVVGDQLAYLSTGCETPRLLFQMILEVLFVKTDFLEQSGLAP